MVGRACVVPGCNSNRARGKQNPSVNSYAFPKDPSLRAEWIQAIGQEGFTPTVTSCVCIKHFDRDDVTWYQEAGGRSLGIPLKIPRLKPNVVPKIIDDPIGCTHSSLEVPKRPGEASQGWLDRTREKENEEIAIKHFTGLLKPFVKKLVGSGWRYYLQDNQKALCMSDDETLFEGVKFWAQLLLDNYMMIKIEMVKKCCILGCRSNYNVVKGDASITTFQFPRDETMKELWVDSIGRENWQPTLFSYVCVLHFAEDDVKQGMKRQVLKQDAVPRIFPDATDVVDYRKSKAVVAEAAEYSSDEFEEEYLEDEEDDNTMNGDVARCHKIPRKCSVPGCKSNYQSYLRENLPLATFGFPKDEDMKKNWIDRIIENTEATTFDATKNSSLCIKHFSQSDIIKNLCVDGTELELEPENEDVVYLSKTAVPLVFPLKPAAVKDNTYKTGVRRCSVPYCKTNSKKILKTEKSDTVFSFPKDDITATLWREKLKHLRNMKVTKKTLICAKHFEEQFLKREHVLENKRSGSVEMIPKKNLTLVKHAYPTIFEDRPDENEPEPIGEVVLDETQENDASSQDETTQAARRSTRKRRKPRKFLKIKPKKIKKEPKTEAETDAEDEELNYNDDDDEIFERRIAPVKKEIKREDPASWISSQKMSKEEIIRYEKVQQSKITQEDEILKFEQLLANIHKIPKNSLWLVAKDGTFVKFFTVKQTMGPPVIDLSVCINRRLIIKIYRGRDELDFIKFSERAGCDGLKYSSIGKLLRFLCDPTNDEDNVARTLNDTSNLPAEITDFKEFVKNIGKTFGDCISYLEANRAHDQPVTNMKIKPEEIPQKISKMKFLQYQLLSVFNKITRYNEEFMEFCIEFFQTHPDVYNWCREKDHFSLPCDRYLFAKVKQEKEKKGEKGVDRSLWNEPGTFRYHGKKVKIYGCRKLTEDEIAEAEATLTPLEMLEASRTDQQIETYDEQTELYDEPETEETEEVYPTSQIRVLAVQPVGGGADDVPIHVSARQNVIQTFETLTMQAPTLIPRQTGPRTIVLNNPSTSSPREIYLAVQNMRGEYIKLEKS